MKKLTKDFVHFIPLLGIALAGFLGFWLFFYNREFQTVIAFAIACSYIAWGIVHHKIHDNLTLEVVIEYVLFALVGLAIMLAIILRA